MLVLILGLILFLGGHAFTMAREPRAAMIGRLGEGGYKGAYTLVSLAGFIAIIIGYGQYRTAGMIPVWNPPFWLGHLVLLLNLPIFVLLAAAKTGGMIHAIVKHPMLLAVKIWATAHLLANGDLGSMLLFGGFLAWAVMARISLKRRAGAGVPPRPAGFTQRDWIAIGVGLVLWFVFARWLHTWLIGVSAWPAAEAAAMTTETPFGLHIRATDGSARTGEIRMPRGIIRTPAFMPVGTAATVKGMYPDQVKALGADVVLGNTYHLMLRPSAERIARLGGLHAFMKWPHPILTDSGGFQVMSLSQLRKITEQGVTFQSHIDGSKYEMSPERSIEIQNLLGSDIVMQLDECVSLPCEDAVAEKAMHLSLRWAERCKVAFGEHPGRALFAIVQGGASVPLRKASATALIDMDFKGYAIGGLAVGEPQDVMLAMIEAVEPYLPQAKPRYLMGVGTPDDICEAVRRGVDMFDCVMPTRAGRHGQVFTRAGRMNLRNAKFAEDNRPIDAASKCPAANGYSRAYLHHLIKSDEMLGKMLLTWVNLAYYQDLMDGLRSAISQGRLADAIAETKEGWARGEPDQIN